MSKNIFDEDFFLSADGDDLFEIKTSHKAKHLCVTDKSVDIRTINESLSLRDTRALVEIVVGFGDQIPLWMQNVTLKWRLHPSFDRYRNSENVKSYIKGILNEAIGKWGKASPVKFEESDSDIDFLVIMEPDNCNDSGCTLASAFFPNSKQNKLTLHPIMFQHNRIEQVETLIHEIGHIFGLRHFFAKEKEASWQSEVFGHHYPLTIMNYGNNSTLTEQDKLDLENLYKVVWNQQLTNINGMPIKLYNPLTQA